MQGLISEYLDQRLSSKENERVESHLQTCDICREECESLRDTVSLLSHTPVIAVRRSFTVAEVRPIPYSFFGTLRTATVVMAAMLVMLFAGDVTNVIPGALPEPAQLTTTETSPSFPPEDGVIVKVNNAGIPTPEGSLSGGKIVPPPKVGEEGPAPESTSIGDTGPSDIVLEAPPAIPPAEEGLWWLHPLEFSLLGVVVIMGGVTLFIWRKRRALCPERIDTKQDNDISLR